MEETTTTSALLKINKDFPIPLTVACVVAGLLVLALDFAYPLLIASGVLYVAFLAIAITARSRFTLWLLTVVYLTLYFLGYVFFDEQIFYQSSSLLKQEGVEGVFVMAKKNMLWMRSIGAVAIVFTAAMGNTLLKISEEVEQKLLNLSITDYLTGVFSRRYLFENIKQRFSDTQRYPESNFSIILLDIDFFKKINDDHSHLAGDVALRQLCDCLKGVVRNIDVLGRYGGEEFMVVSPNSNIEGAKLLAERIRVAVEGLPITFQGKVIPLTVSLGVTDYRTHSYTSTDDMIHAADDALYRAKGNGRNQFQTA